MVLSEENLQSIRDAAAIIVDSEYVTCLTGAGISVESGIRPFRGPGGLWTEKGEPSMDGYRRFLSDPKAYWEKRMERSGEFGLSLENKDPNPGHVALARLEEVGVLRSLITQNIDDLHNQAGSVNVLEIHGNSSMLRCIECSTRWGSGELEIDELPPKCPHCGGPVKTDTVMFGEPIPSAVLSRCFEEAERSDCMIVAGTSALVTPAAHMPMIVRRNAGKLVEVNIMETEISYACDVSILSPSGESLPILVEEIEKLT